MGNVQYFLKFQKITLDDIKILFSFNNLRHNLKGDSCERKDSQIKHKLKSVTTFLADHEYFHQKAPLN